MLKLKIIKKKDKKEKINYLCITFFLVPTDYIILSFFWSNIDIKYRLKRIFSPFFGYS